MGQTHGVIILFSQLKSNIIVWQIIWTDRLADQEDILRDTGAKEIIELRSKKLELSDWVAAKVHKWAITIATIEGAATGAGGIITLPVDIPFLITFSLKTIHKIGRAHV
jgi:hypothetical protein